MAVHIRLARTGVKKKAFYRIVAADSRMKRDGRFLEKLGTYNPASKEINIVRESIEKWLATGATPSNTVTRLLIAQGFDLVAPAHKPAKTVEKKAAEKAAEKAS